MDQGLIDSYSHDPKNSYHCRKSKVKSGQSKNNNSSSDSKKHTRNNNDSILDIIELNDKHQNHQNKSDKHSLTQILRS